ncbi:hypothetical protein M8756_14965 [Lutimaribacter sp. EGI FJ00015]|uniref:Uncharacterized protein n=1 Tax=Lutimaribacter degradans TaxID=2945989 RepID=A0ACC6A113_9RHOB|nr:hypothetical protein [Lutimaribacter sp. EGI FJ00013]MCM2563439.1 hypothetical protein [Lutimaribacter sp. EGI FJ00013]MCO0614619.1 hypothetical protein [Lutimaribacter sp. EGI FJ00015]MCO0637290.1 hypothetical protein [Lutimaribacter sp. EGI FJ00014]
MLPKDTQKAIDAILAAPSETIADLICEMRNKKQLSSLVHDLNDCVLFGEPEQKTRATQALVAMGFALR